MRMLHASRIPVLVRMQDRFTAQWHRAPRFDSDDLIMRLHHNNFLQWHQENVSRDPRSNVRAIAQSKMNIDRLNGIRNGLTEEIDACLLASLPPAKKTVPFHSETPGAMLDRLSIISLRLYHTRLSTKGREGRAKLAVLNEQRADLARALQRLLAELWTGKKRLKLYRNLKVYRDKASQGRN